MLRGYLVQSMASWSCSKLHYFFQNSLFLRLCLDWLSSCSLNCCTDTVIMLIIFIWLMYCVELMNLLSYFNDLFVCGEFRMEELFALQYQLMGKGRKQEMKLVTLLECLPVILNQALSRYLMERHWFWNLITVAPRSTQELWGSSTFWLQSHHQIHRFSYILHLMYEFYFLVFSDFFFFGILCLSDLRDEDIFSGILIDEQTNK